MMMGQASGSAPAPPPPLFILGKRSARVVPGVWLWEWSAFCRAGAHGYVGSVWWFGQAGG